MSNGTPLAGMSNREKDKKLIGFMRRRRREATERKITGSRLTGGVATAATALGGGYLWAKQPQIRRLFTGGGTRAGVDSRYVVGIPLLIWSLMPRSPLWAKDVGEALMVPALWDQGVTWGGG